MKICIDQSEVEIDFDYGQEVWFLKDGKPVHGKINGVVILAKPKSGSQNNRYLALFSVYTSSGEELHPYGTIASSAEKAYRADEAKLLFVSSNGNVTERGTRDWLIPSFVKMTGEFLSTFH